MRLHQNLTSLAFTLCFIVVVGFSCQASAQMSPIVRPIVVGTFTGKTAHPRGQTCFYVEDESAGQVIARNGTVLNVSAEQRHFLFPGDVRCPKTVPIWHGGSWPASSALLGLHDYFVNSNTDKEKHHLCGYYLDEDQLAYWRSKHPNAPRPLFEAVVPATTQCPSPPDDYTPFELMTPAEHLKYEGPVLTDCKARRLDALTKLAPAGTSVSRSSLEYASIESKFESCLTAGGAATRGVMLQALKELPELTASRRLAPGVEELSLGTAQGQDCWQVQINGGNPIDQYLCIDPSKGVIYVGTQYTTPPQIVPLSQWRVTHTGFTYQGRPVLLSVVEQQTAKNREVSDAAEKDGSSTNNKPENSPKQVTSTNVRMDPNYPLKIGHDYYPEASLKAGEEGRCVVKITVSAEGLITDESLQTSTSFPRLDEACMAAFKGQRLIPATENGKPIERIISIPVVWSTHASQ
jgi:TonB family protein